MRDLSEFDILDRMVRAVEKVRERLSSIVAVLESRSVDYALSGDLAVAAWVATVDPSAVRNTPQVELLIKRDDVDEVHQAMASLGYLVLSAHDTLKCVDDSSGNKRTPVHFIFASESVAASDPPSIKNRLRLASSWVLTVDAIVRMNLSRFRTLNRLRLRDLIDVGLIDSSWVPRLPAELATRLQQLLDTPEG